MYRVGIDTGGTFTDTVCIDQESGKIVLSKVPTTTEDPSVGFLDGLDRTGIDLRDISYLAHGTTLATNCVLTLGGAKVGIITTKGFRDVLEIMRTHRKTLFNLYEEKPPPLVPRSLRMEVTERVDWKGEIVVPLEEEDVRRSLRSLIDSGVECIAVSLLFSFRNPRHERRIREIALGEFPEVKNVSLSSEILPTYKEYERTSTTVLNAYTVLIMDQYLARIEDELAQKGYESDLIIMQGTGGVMTSTEARLRPVYTLLSGPAGGVIGGHYVANRSGYDTLLTMDMGGTSFDVACVIDGDPDRKMEYEVADSPGQHGYAVGLPTIDVRSIGAGGGSIAWVDQGGALHVGPQSAGSLPGPVCYARGGTEPTVTDANVVLGRYNPQFILGGAMELDRDGAYRAIAEKVATPLGIEVEEAALGILSVVNSNMSYAVRNVTVEKGRDPRDFVAVAFGGAGPSHVVDIAKETGIPRILIPPFPGLTSALGVLAADIQHHYIRTVATSCDKINITSINSVYDEMRKLAEYRLARDGVASGDQRLLCEADLRYSGQAYELTMPIAVQEKLTRQDIMGSAEAFHTKHRELYGHNFPGQIPELVNLRVTGIGAVRKPKMPKPIGDGSERALVGRRKVLWGQTQEYLDTPIYDRAHLGEGSPIEGPAIIEQMDTTTTIPPGYRGEIDRVGILVIQRG